MATLYRQVDVDTQLADIENSIDGRVGVVGYVSLKSDHVLIRVANWPGSDSQLFIECAISDVMSTYSGEIADICVTAYREWRNQ